MKKILKILLFIVGMVYAVDYPALWILIATYIIYNYFGRTVAKIYNAMEKMVAKIFNINISSAATPEPRNWREAMAQSQYSI